MRTKNEDGYHDLPALRARLPKWRSEAEDYLGEWHPQAKEDMAFYHGHQWLEADKKAMEGRPGAPGSKRPMATFNRTAPIVRATYGAMVHNQMEIGYVRRVSAQPKGGVAKDEVLSAGAQYFRSQPIWNAAAEERDMFHDLLCIGLGCSQLITETEISGQTEIVGRRVDPFCVGWDTRATRSGLTDRRWHFYKTRLSEEEVVDEFGKVPSKEEIAHGGRADTNDRPGIKSDDGFEIYHWQWYETESFYWVLVPDESSEEGVARRGVAARDLRAMQEGIDFAFAADEDRQSRRRRVYWEAFCHGDTILRVQKIGVNAFTYEFATGIRDQETGLWYGLIRDAKDPQRWANKFLSLFIWNVMVSGKGVYAEADAFDDLEEAQRDWVNPARMTITRPGAVSGGKISPKPENKLPPSADKILDFSTSAVREVLGIPLEQIAQQMNDQSGVVEESRKTAAMAVVAWAFAAHRDYLHRHGHLLLKFMVAYIDEGRLIKTVDPSGQSQFVPFTAEEAAYEVEVDEVPNSPNKKAEVHRTLVAYAPLLQQPEIPVSFKTAYLLEMMRSSSIPSDTVRRLEAAAAPPPDPMAEQMKLAQAETVMQELEKLKAEVVKLQSAALLDVAKAKETGQEAETAQRIAQTEIEQKVIEGNLKLELQERKADQELQKGTMKLQMDGLRNQQALQFQHDQQQLRAAEPRRQESN